MKKLIRNNYTGEMEEYEMPDVVPQEVSVGQCLLWYQDGNVKAAPKTCIVQRVGDRTIAVMIFEAGGMFGHMVEGVRSIHDPDLAKLPQSAKACGCWDFTDDYKELRKLADRVASLGGEKPEVSDKKLDGKFLAIHGKIGTLTGRVNELEEKLSGRILALEESATQTVGN